LLVVSLPALCSVAVLVLPGLYVMSGHPISMSRLEKVQQGMTFEQVRQLLGSPTSVRHGDEGTIDWVYSSKWKWCYVMLSFSAEGRYTEYYHDH
jgi:outer membrane protein assembly factor BamE (lipoprotein component of BamABCDE complex)